MKKKLLIAGSILGMSALVVAAYLLGKNVGENGFIENIIHLCENGNDDYPVYTSSDKNLGNLMYEIKAECIGD